MRIRSVSSRCERRDGFAFLTMSYLRHQSHAWRAASLHGLSVVDRSSESLVAPIVTVRDDDGGGRGGGSVLGPLSCPPFIISPFRCFR